MAEVVMGARLTEGHAYNAHTTFPLSRFRKPVEEIVQA